MYIFYFIIIYIFKVFYHPPAQFFLFNVLQWDMPPFARPHNVDVDVLEIYSWDINLLSIYKTVFGPFPCTQLYPFNILQANEQNRSL